MKMKLQNYFRLLIILFLSSIGFAQSTYRMEIEVSEQASVSLSNYQVDLSFDTEALILTGKMNTDGSDMKFYEDSCLTTPIPFWIESGTNSASTQVWLNMLFIPTNTVT